MKTTEDLNQTVVQTESLEDRVTAILARVTTADVAATSGMFSEGLAIFDRVESDGIAQTIAARRVIGAASDHFYRLAHTKATKDGSLSAVVSSVPESVREGRSDSFLRLAIRTARLFSHDDYAVWSDARHDVKIRESDPAAFNATADSWLRWQTAKAEGRTSDDGAILAPSSTSNRSGTGKAAPQQATQTLTQYRKGLAKKAAAKVTRAANAAAKRDTFGKVRRADVDALTDDDLNALRLYVNKLTHDRKVAADKAAAKVKAAADKAAAKAAAKKKAAPKTEDLAKALQGLSAGDLAKVLASAKAAAKK